MEYNIITKQMLVSVIIFTQLSLFFSVDTKASTSVDINITNIPSSNKDTISNKNDPSLDDYCYLLNSRRYWKREDLRDLAKEGSDDAIQCIIDLFLREKKAELEGNFNRMDDLLHTLKRISDIESAAFLDYVYEYAFSDGILFKNRISALGYIADHSKDIKHDYKFINYLQNMHEDILLEAGMGNNIINEHELGFLHEVFIKTQDKELIENIVNYIEPSLNRHRIRSMSRLLQTQNLCSVRTNKILNNTLSNPLSVWDVSVLPSLLNILINNENLLEMNDINVLSDFTIKYSMAKDYYLRRSINLISPTYDSLLNQKIFGINDLPDIETEEMIYKSLTDPATNYYAVDLLSTSENINTSDLVHAINEILESDCPYNEMMLLRIMYLIKFMNNEESTSIINDVLNNSQTPVLVKIEALKICYEMVRRNNYDQLDNFCPHEYHDAYENIRLIVDNDPELSKDTFYQMNMIMLSWIVDLKAETLSRSNLLYKSEPLAAVQILTRLLGVSGDLDLLNILYNSTRDETLYSTHPDILLNVFIHIFLGRELLGLNKNEMYDLLDILDVLSIKHNIAYTTELYDMRLWFEQEYAVQ